MRDHQNQDENDRDFSDDDEGPKDFRGEMRFYIVIFYYLVLIA